MGRTGAKKTATKATTHFAIVLDNSGSMTSLRREAVAAVNANIKNIKDSAAKCNQVATVSLYLFDYTAHMLRRLAMAGKVKPLSLEEYRPNGMTAMLDGVNLAIEEFQSLAMVGDDTSYVILTITDGAENSSKQTTAKKLAAKIKKCESTDLWSFAFLVPPGHETVPLQFHIPQGNIAVWEQTGRGVEELSNTTQSAVSHYFDQRSKGETSTRGFFTDLKNLTKAEVKQALDDMSSNVKVLKVLAESDIRTFAEGQLNMDYNSELKGKCYYQLTKPETVQGYKKVLIKEIKGRKIYGGTMEEMRSIIGIPGTAGTKIQVKPGNHGDWAVFVQSTSVNRKLVRGTDMLVII